MLITFAECVNLARSKKDITGIIHLGSDELQEKADYNKHGVDNIIWIDAIKEKVDKYSETDKVYNIVVSDKDNEEVEFKITNNSQSSSILELGTHKNHHPHVIVVDTIKLKTTRMDTFIEKENIDIKQFNFVNLDLQGVELRALKSFGNLLNNIDYIYTEVNDEEVYVNCDLISDIDKYLETFGFKRVLTNMTPYHWGDAFYIKQNIN